MAKKIGSSGVSEKSETLAKKTTAKVTEKVVVAVRKASASKSPTAKSYKVKPARAKGKGQTVIISGHDKALQTNTPLKPGKIVSLKPSRSDLVGKHPEVHHLPAPKATLKLDDETRKSLLASMVLV